MSKDCKPNVPFTGAGSPNSGNAALEKLCEILEVLEKPTPEASNFGKVGCITNAAGTTTGEVYVSRTLAPDGTSIFTYWAFIPGMEPIENYQGAWGLCPDDVQLITSEIGCLSEPGTLDMTDVERCGLAGVRIDGVLYPFTLAEGWTGTQLAAAVNAQAPGTLLFLPPDQLATPGRSLANIQFVCTQNGAPTDLRSYVAEPKGRNLPVEIIKSINRETATVDTLRVFSPDSTIEYPIPDPQGRILTTGACHVISVGVGASTSTTDCPDEAALGVQTNWG